MIAPKSLKLRRRVVSCQPRANLAMRPLCISGLSGLEAASELIQDSLSAYSVPLVAAGSAWDNSGFPVCPPL
jgi:hypothetical protein